MKINKNMIIAITITFCFIASIFMVIPIRSQSSGQYDPWLDINDDGRINMDEIVASTTNFGTTGDPTKNVNVTNLHDYKVQTGNLTMGYLGWDAPLIYCGGYSRLSILLAIRSTNLGGNSITIYLYGIQWNETGRDDVPSAATSFDGIYDPSVFNVTTDFIYGIPLQTSRSYITETKAPYCRLVLVPIVKPEFPTDWWVTVYYAVYLRNE